MTTKDEPTNVVYSAEPEEEQATIRTSSFLIFWQDSMFVPNNPRCVLATDGEEHFIACYHEDKWWNVHTDEEIDSVIIAWMELPEPPEA